ncbi:MAG: CAP domain-containing protein [Chloroflexota bacterium]|nr:MAG: hypothetical protein DIU80_10325 [Chloroflexota bacterium]
MNTALRLLLALIAALLLASHTAAQSLQDTLSPMSYLPLVTARSEPASQRPTPVPTVTVPPPTATPDSCARDGAGFPLDSRCFSNEVVRLVNIERAKAGCPAAVIDERLMLGAQNWSLEMQRSGYRHSPLGWYTRPENGGFESTSVGENIGPSGDPQSIVDAWMASAEHRNLILSCTYSNPQDPAYDPNAVYEIGVGNLGGVWWVLALDEM